MFELIIMNLVTDNGSENRIENISEFALDEH